MLRCEVRARASLICGQLGQEAGYHAMLGSNGCYGLPRQEQIIRCLRRQSKMHAPGADWHSSTHPLLSYCMVI